MVNDLNFTDLSVNQVPKLYKRRQEIFKSNVFDMSQVTKIDSSGIAFLVKWSKACPNKKLKIKNIKEEAKALITVFHVDSLFIIE